MKYTEEEEKAIGIVHGLLVTVFNYSGYTENGVFWQHEVDFKRDNPFYSNAIEVVLNLLEKQRKENEMLKEALKDKCEIADERNNLLVENNKLKEVIDVLSFEVSSLDGQLVLNRFKNKEEVKQFFMEKLDLKYIPQIVSPIYVKENYIPKEAIREKKRERELQRKMGIATSEDRIHLDGEIFAYEELLGE